MASNLPPQNPASFSGVHPYTAPVKLRPPKSSFDYSRLVKDALSLVWRHKFLWFYGLFAAGSTTSFNSVGNFSGNISDRNYDTPSGPSQFTRDVSDFIHLHLTLIIAGVVAFLILLVVLWLWSIICRGAVIGSTEDIEENAPTGFGAAFRRGKQSFVRLLLFDLFLTAIGLGLLVIFAALIVFAVFLAVAMAAAGKIVLIIISVLLLLAVLSLLTISLGYFFCLAFWIVFWIPLSLLMIYATRAVVLEDAGPIEALRRGGRMMLNTASRTLLLFLLAFGLGIAGNIIWLAAVAISAVPAVIVLIITAASGWPIAGIAVVALAALLPVATAVLGYAIMNTYFTVYWTDVYRELTGRKAATVKPAAAANTVPAF